MTPTGLNYAAQLDCAMDVARAMLHLHYNNVSRVTSQKCRSVLEQPPSLGQSIRGDGLLLMFCARVNYCMPARFHEVFARPIPSRAHAPPTTLFGCALELSPLFTAVSLFVCRLPQVLESDLRAQLIGCTLEPSPLFTA
eukprot:scaffold82416_cov22-Tisochrysis_lutea.AAC.1